MPKDADKQTDAELAELASGWLDAFGAALAAGDVAAAAAMFLPTGHWRDILSFTWHIETVSGRDAVARQLDRTLAETGPTGFRLAAGRTPPRQVVRAGEDAVEALFDFDTATGPGSGVLRLQADADGVHRAWILTTTLDAIRGHEERLSEARAGGDAFKREFGGENWLDLRTKAAAYADRDPACLVVGGGQAGLAIAARLTHLGVDTLIIDSHERIGDNWRKRYHSLTLHNEVHVNHMPYMPFPPTWPVYIPKDMLANWFEAYVEALELNYWASTTLAGGTYDDATDTWELTLELGGGTRRIMRPRHVVLATGVSAIPIVPELPGLDEFAGEVVHSGAYTDGHAWKGKQAFVLGTGNSGHDVAHDLHASGARVTMIQRASTHIVSLAEAQKPYAIYAEGPPMEDCDLLAVSFPFPVLRQGYQVMTAASKLVDKPLLDRLEARGFRLNDGVDDCGFQMSYLQRGGGYYFDVGASTLIADGEIDILNFAEIETFSTDGAVLRDGSTRAADLLVLATGFKSQRDTTRVILNDAVAERTGPVWGFSDGGELNSMWVRTPQPGLWYTAGSLAQCRIYSKYLALQIKACEEGLIAKTRP